MRNIIHKSALLVSGRLRNLFNLFRSWVVYSFLHVFFFYSYDRTLGGLEIQIRLRDYLAKAFNDMKKTKNDVFQNPRSMAKLFKEAGRVKNVLSANVDHYAQVENLIDEQDFRFQVLLYEKYFLEFNNWLLCNNF